ncbi:unnamed protein product [Gadus morhua 'NCC']
MVCGPGGRHDDKEERGADANPHSEQQRAVVRLGGATRGEGVLQEGVHELSCLFLSLQVRSLQAHRGWKSPALLQGHPECECSLPMAALPRQDQPASSQPQDHPVSSQDQPASSQPQDQPASSQPQDQPASSQPQDQPASSLPQDQPASSQPQDQPASSQPQDQPASASPRNNPQAASPRNNPQAASPRNNPQAARCCSEAAPAPDCWAEVGRGICASALTCCLSGGLG